jgi:hypothetical protein
MLKTINLLTPRILKQIPVVQQELFEFIVVEVIAAPSGSADSLVGLPVTLTKKGKSAVCAYA